MRADELKELVEAGENSLVEFKLLPLEPDKLRKQAVAFSNLQGGVLLLGVSDAGEIVGIDSPQVGRTRLDEWIVDVCRDEKMVPPITPVIDTVKIDGKLIYAIRFHQGIDKPYFLKEGETLVPYIRAGASVRQASRDELRRLYQASGSLHYEINPILHASVDDLDMAKIEGYFRDQRGREIAREGEDAKIRLLSAAKILCECENKRFVPSLAGMLLFGQNPERFLAQSGIMFACYKGTEISDDLLDRKVLDETLRENIDNACQAVRMNVAVRSRTKGTWREEKVIYPERVVREAIINACAHRDYTIHGAKIIVALFDDRLTVKSPGRPPNTVTVESMKLGYTVPRNPLIAKFLMDYYGVEGLGNGVPMMVREMLKVSGIEPDIQVLEDQTIVTLHKGDRGD